MSDTNSDPVEYSSDEDDSSDNVEIITNNVHSLSVGPSQRNAVLQGTAANTSRILPSSRFRMAVPRSQIARRTMENWNDEREYHKSMCPTGGDSTGKTNSTHLEEIRTTPIFSADVLAKVLNHQAKPEIAGTLLPEYGFLARSLEEYCNKSDSDLFGTAPDSPITASREPTVGHNRAESVPDDDRLMVNMNAPWSAFICGSQGSGKSYTLSCMLENALVGSGMAKLPNKLAGMVFHYDKFTAISSTQVCEAAYLASKIPVKVLVSSSNYKHMKDVYENLPGFPKDAKKPKVMSLLLEEKHLNVERMLNLMAVDEKEGRMALYMESVCRILRSIAMQNQGAGALNYNYFKERLEVETLNDGQKAMLNTRLQLLESFMWLSGTSGAGSLRQEKPGFSDMKKGQEKERKWLREEDARVRAEMGGSDAWLFEPGSLTIVDLSCPFVDESTACSMFNISLALFLEDRAQAGRIVALDEAHKFMTATDSSSQFTESLLSVIRQQRHLATRVIIATQEPTISPALLDLSSMTIVHRFTSREWMTALKSHLAGVPDEGENSKRNVEEIFKRIVNLDAGQALLFSPAAMLGPEGDSDPARLSMRKLGTGYLKVQVRKRLTADGGRSILAV